MSVAPDLAALAPPEGAKDGLAVLDEEGRIVFADARLEEIFRRAREDLVGRPFASLLAEGTRARFAHGPLQASVPFPGAEALVGLRADGAEMAIEVEVAPMRTAEGSFFHVAIRPAAASPPEPEPLPASDRRLARPLVRRIFAALVDRAGVSAEQLAEAGRQIACETPASTLHEHMRALEEMGLGRVAFERAATGGRYFFEGADLLERRPAARFPTCAFTLGYLAEAVGQMHGGEPSVGAELECRSTGAPRCRFVVHVRPSDRLAGRVRELV